jgi:DNA primase
VVFCCFFNGARAFHVPRSNTLSRAKYNIEIEETELTDAEKANTDIRESMYLVSNLPKYFHQTLLKSEEGKAIGLLIFKERGFETIEKFSLGYSPESWDALTKEALGKGIN